MKKLFKQNCFILLFFAFFVTEYSAQTAVMPDGSGTSEDPYRMATWQNLYWLSQNSGYWDDHFKQMDDISFPTSGDDNIQNWDGGGGWTPIGNSSTFFTGDYDGNGKIIRNLYIYRSGTNEQAFFDFVYSGSYIHELSLENCYVKGRHVVGGLIARVYHSASDTSISIVDCHVSGSIVGTYDEAGGLIGRIEVYENVTGGDTYNVFVTECSADISITAAGKVGGLIGECGGYSSTKNPRIKACYSYGTVSSSGSAGHLGGLFGTLEKSSVSNSYSMVKVRGNIGDDAGGGLIGGVGSGVEISHCYSTGYVSGFYQIRGRGFIGSYNTSYPPVISNCFWSSESSGQTGSGAPSGVTDKTVAEMKTLSTYTNAGWDFDGSTGGDDYFWAMDDSKNGGYPYLWWQSFPYNVTFTDGSSYSGSPIAGETNQPFGRFSLLADHSGADLVGVWIELTGTRTGVSNLKFWYSDDNSFDSSSDFQLSATVSSDPGEGETISFINFSQDIGTGNAYFFLTCDLAADATGLLRGKIVGNQDVFLKKASLNSTIDNAYLSADDIPLPVTLSSFSGALINSLPTLYWTTQSETDNLGWNVYRSNLANGWEMNDYLQLNGDLIPGMGTTSVPTDYSFIDDQTIAEGTYYYWLESVSFSNELASFGPVEIRIDATMLPDLPTQSFLNCNYPNPFNPVTTIYFGIKEKEEGILTILNIKGQKIISKKFQKGYHTYVWNASCQASGVYFFRLQTASCNHIRKAILMK